MQHQIIEFLRGKEKVTLKEFYNALPDTPQASIRAVLNNGFKKGIIERIAKATYKLK